MGVRRWVEFVLGIPARQLMRSAARGMPHIEHDGLHLIVADGSLAAQAEPFFKHTTDALRQMSTDAPRAYSGFKRDVGQVLLWDRGRARAYNRFQRAVVVPPEIALEQDRARYAAWLLHASGRGEHALADVRTSEFLAHREAEDRSAIAHWLTSVTERAPP